MVLQRLQAPYDAQEAGPFATMDEIWRFEERDVK
jgi:hypothetical protein